MRQNVRRLLAAGLLLTIMLPMVIALSLGLGALLAALGDDAGARGCGRLGLAVGGAWFLALATTATAGGILMLEDENGRTDGTERACRDRSPLEQ